MKKVISLCLTLAFAALTFTACGREKLGNLEFVLDEATDTYTLVYYTDTAKTKDLIIPDEFNGKRVTGIGQLAIGSADNLEKITLGRNIESIARWGIVDCLHLKAIEVAEENAQFKSVDGVLYSKDGTRLIAYPNANTAVYAEDGKLQHSAVYAVLPGTQTIGHCAFYKCYALRQAVLPESVEVIEERAFHKAGITQMEFPEGLASIGMDAFLGCEGLTELTLPASLREIGDFAFYSAFHLKTIHIKAPEGSVTLGEKWYPTMAGQKINDLNIIWEK